MSGAVRALAPIAGAIAGAVLIGGSGGLLTPFVGAVAATAIGSVTGSMVASAVFPPQAPQMSAVPELPTILTPATTASFETAASGALVNTSSPVDPIPVVYGSRQKGGTRVFPGNAVSGAQNEYLHVLITLAESQISAINTVYLDDVASSDSRFTGLVDIEKYLGTDTQAASSALISATGGTWTSAHQGKGVAYLYVRLKWSRDAFPSGLPTITADVDGRLVYDPRDGTTAFKNNPALCIRDYLTNSRYGRGIASAKIDDASFIVAANHCDELVTSPGGNQKRYTCDGVLNPDDGWVGNLQALLSSCRGSIVFSGGKYRLWIDKLETPRTDFAFSEDNIVGVWNIRNAGKREKFNRVKARFFNPDQNWQADLAIWDDTTHRSSDNGLVLESELSLPYTANLYRAQRIAQLVERQSRFGIVASFRCTVAGLGCEVGDVVPITHSTPGWSAKPFRIVNMELLASDEVAVTVREYQDAVYSLATLTTAAVIPATNLPNIRNVPEPAGLSFASGTSELFVAGDGTVFPRIRMTWNAPADLFVLDGGRTEIQFKEFAGSPSEWSPSLFFDGAMTFAYLNPVEDGRAYEIRIRHENRAGIASGWTSDTHTVIGKTALPSDVTGFSAVQSGTVVLFDTDRVTDSDLDSIEIRYVEVAGTWENASPLCNILRGETDTSAAVPPGTWDMLAKAKDTSGNYSNAAARVRLTVSADGFSSIYSTDECPRLTGSRQNMVRHWTGVLTPESRSLASELGWEVFDEFVPNAFTDCYYEANVIDKSIDATARVWADIVSVLGPGETTGIANPKLQIDTRLSSGSFDGFDNWTVGSANFRYLKARVYVDTTLGKPVISSFEINIDNTARSEEFQNQAIGSGGTAITFSTPFHATPVIQITPRGTTALIPTAETPSATGFTAHLYNTSGAGAAGNADIRATGP